MPERRPEWCNSIGCPFRPAYDGCHLKEYIIKGWPSAASRRRELTRIQKKVAQSPQDVIDECMRTMTDVR